MELDLKKQNSDFLFKQPNIISKGLYTMEMTSTSYKLIRYGFYLLQELNKNVESSKITNEIEFSVSDFCNCLEISQGGTRTETIKKALEEIRQSGIKVENINEEGNQTFTVFNWVYTATTDFNSIIIRFNPDLVKVMLNNINQYSTLELIAIGKLKNIYALRIYELLKSFYNTKGKKKFQMKRGEWKTNYYTIDYLREYFNTGDKYERESSFIEKCIKNPVQEINKVIEKLNFNFTVSYDIKKLGKIKEIQFIGNEVYQNNKLDYNKNDTPEIREDKKEMASDNVELINFKKNYTSEEWEYYKTEFKKINPIASVMEDGPFLDSSIMQYIKNLQNDIQPNLF